MRSKRRSAMRSDLPTGTVTFLFTDVEGSTRLLHELGAEAYAEALAEHRRVIREACAAESGVEVDTQGDAFFFAFPTAPGALAAASALHRCARLRPDQRARRPAHRDAAADRRGLRRRRRPPRGPHRRRRPRRAGARLVLDCPARRASSSPTSASTGSRTSPLPSASTNSETASFRRSSRSTARTCPCPRRPSSGASASLPRSSTLLAEDARLLTLTGPGGTGKTRLALQAAGRGLRGLSRTASGGCRSLPCATPRSSSTTAAQVARLQERPRRAHRRQGDALPLRQLRAGRGGGAGARRRCSAPAPTSTCSSRAGSACASGASRPTRCRHSPSRTERRSSCARARAVDPALRPKRGRRASSACASTSSRSRSSSPPPARPSSAPSSCSSGSPSASTCSRASATPIPASRPCARRSSGRTTSSQRTSSASSPASPSSPAAARYEAAEEIAGADPDTLQSLLDKSLVRKRDSKLGPRYWMLETIREYAAERLEDVGRGGGAAAAACRRTSSISPRRRSAHLVTGGKWLDRLDVEVDNIRSALDFATETEPSARFGQPRRSTSSGSCAGTISEGTSATRECPCSRPRADCRALSRAHRRDRRRSQRRIWRQRGSERSGRRGARPRDVARGRSFKRARTICRGVALDGRRRVVGSARDPRGHRSRPPQVRRLGYRDPGEPVTCMDARGARGHERGSGRLPRRTSNTPERTVTGGSRRDHSARWPSWLRLRGGSKMPTRCWRSPSGSTSSSGISRSSASTSSGSRRSLFGRASRSIGAQLLSCAAALRDEIGFVVSSHG